MVTKKKKIQFMISSNSKLNSNLTILREITGRSNARIISEIIQPLTDILSNLKQPCSYYIVPYKHEILIGFYSAGSYVKSGKLTSTLDDTILGAD